VLTALSARPAPLVTALVATTGHRPRGPKERGAAAPAACAVCSL